MKGMDSMRDEYPILIKHIGQYKIFEMEQGRWKVFTSDIQGQILFSPNFLSLYEAENFCA